MPQFERRPLAAAVLMVFSAPLALAQAQTAAPPPAGTGAAAGSDAVAQAVPPAAVQPQPDPILPEVRVRERPESEGFRTDSTRGATRTETPLRDIPQFVNTVPQSLIQSQGAKTLQEALRNVPGITYAAPEGGTQAAQVYYMRGFQSGGNLFLGGVRDIGEYNRDLFAIDSVEVLKGPGGLMFGRGSTAGVINQVPKYADLLPRKDVDLTLGSFDTRRATADLNLPFSQTSAVRLVALAEDSGSYRYPQDVEKAGFAPSLRLGIGTGTEVTLAYYYLKTSDVTDYGQPTLFTNPNTGGVGFWGLAPVSPRAFYGSAVNDYTDHETNIATFIVDHEFTRNVAVRNTLRWANYQRDLEATIPSISLIDFNGNPVTRATPLHLLRVQSNHDGGRTRTNDDKVLINQTELAWKVGSGAVKHTVLAGIELASEKLDRRNYLLDANPATPLVDTPQFFSSLFAPQSQSPLSYAKVPNQNAKSEGDTVAFYAQDQVELTREWKALLGLRWERYKASAVTIDFATGQPTATGGPFGRTDRMTSGRAGLIWQPTDTQSYYAAYSTSYNPSGELGVYGGNATNLNVQTQLLEPEKNIDYEIGAEWNLWSAARLRAALFHNEKENARVDLDPSAVTVTALAGKQRVEGLELELAGRIHPSWDVYATYAYMDSKVLDDPNGFDGNKLLVPRNSGNLWTVYRLGGGWEIGGGVFWSDERPMNLANTPGAVLPSYYRWDATVAYVQRKYEVRLNLFNLTDEVYYYGAYQNSASRVLPGQPRSAAVTLRYKFD